METTELSVESQNLWIALVVAAAGGASAALVVTVVVTDVVTDVVTLFGATEAVGDVA